ncbi:MAG: hypothetical protein L0215_09185 [Gemmataceae bacterium]|nr:hypothetical protein [Gemmataceae bacterium]
MKAVFFGLLCLAVAGVLGISASMGQGEGEPKKKKPAEAESPHTEWLAKSLREMQTIRPGMTRAELLKVFQEQGGLSTRTQRTYAYRGSPYIHVDVTFEAVGAPQDKLTESAHDKITKITKPYLEWTFSD